MLRQYNHFLPRQIQHGSLAALPLVSSVRDQLCHSVRAHQVLTPSRLEKVLTGFLGFVRFLFICYPLLCSVQHQDRHYDTQIRST